MGSSIFSLLCLLIIAMSVHGGPDPTLNNHWKLWTQKHQKVYNDATEEMKRRMIWEDSLKFVTIHNLEHSLGLHTYEVGMNHMADLTTEEVVGTMTGFEEPEMTELNYTSGFSHQDVIQNSIDWRHMGCVTPVKHQGACNSCWAFSVTGSLECQHMLTSGRLESLSEQQLVDCGFAFGTSGCMPGGRGPAFNYIIAHGLTRESSYPYTGVVGRCLSAVPVARCRGFHTLPPRDEQTLQQAVGIVGPVSVGINVSRQSFRLYTNGVYYDPNCSNNNNHAVLVVGYGTENGMDYWLVKNSWGAGFGQQGYIKMARNLNNHCGIANRGMYPLM